MATTIGQSGDPMAITKRLAEAPKKVDPLIETHEATAARLTREAQMAEAEAKGKAELAAQQKEVQDQERTRERLKEVIGGSERGS